MVDELFDVGTFDVERARGSVEAAEQRGRAHRSGDDVAGYQEPMSLRWECSDINMPKPANRVTIDVPP